MQALKKKKKKRGSPCADMVRISNFFLMKKGKCQCAFKFLSWKDIQNTASNHYRREEQLWFAGRETQVLCYIFLCLFLLLF